MEFDIFRYVSISLTSFGHNLGTNGKPSPSECPKVKGLLALDRLKEGGPINDSSPLDDPD